VRRECNPACWCSYSTYIFRQRQFDIASRSSASTFSVIILLKKWVSPRVSIVPLWKLLQSSRQIRIEMVNASWKWCCQSLPLQRSESPKIKLLFPTLILRAGIYQYIPIFEFWVEFSKKEYFNLCHPVFFFVSVQSRRKTFVSLFTKTSSLVEYSVMFFEKFDARLALSFDAQPFKRDSYSVRRMVQGD